MKRNRGGSGQNSPAHQCNIMRQLRGSGVKSIDHISNTSPSCFSNDDISKLVSLWNSSHGDDPVGKSQQEPSPQSLLQQLNEKVSHQCNGNEKCITDLPFVRKNPELAAKLKSVFAPMAPKSWEKNPNEWLNSSDISRIMKLLENEYPELKFIGPSPIDFNSMDSDVVGKNQCVWPDLCNFSLSSHLANGKTKFGFIFNTDPHTEPGEHWVSMFMHIGNEAGERSEHTAPSFVHYFDSTGDPPPTEITELVEMIGKQAMELDIQAPQFSRNEIVHQKQNTECGIYALYFIASMTSRHDHLEKFNSGRISDSEMSEYRKKFWNTNE